MNAIERKAAAYDQIALSYKLGTCESNCERLVTEACYARELRIEATRTRDEAVDLHLAALCERDEARAEIARLRAAVERVGNLVSEHGCDCECDCDYDGHDDDCDVCFACLISDEVSHG